MVFSSITFLFFFFPLFLLSYYLLPWKNGVMLLGSLIFYAWGEPRFVPLLLLSALINYSFGYAISRFHTRRKPLLAVGIAINLGLLVYYKYLGFFAGLLNALIAPLGHGFDFPDLALPLGISFFTFQGISYLIDVYWHRVGAQKSFLNFAMYKTMFPQLIAGPIVRYRDVAAEIEERVVNNGRVWRGLQLFVIGLSQKVLIANTVAVPADRIFGTDPAQLSSLHAWLGVGCYTVQILYDFAGYSNMAIGIGHMLGFTYPRNFDRPYSARSVTEFWRRWHISLSSWFRDYLYIPLGGNRLSPLRTYLNLSLVFLLCGFWHGAAWTFIVWGAWHGLLLVVERTGFGSVLQRLPGLLAQAYTLLVVMIGWVFFRAGDVPYALRFIGALFDGSAGRNTRPWQMHVDSIALCALLAGALLASMRKRAPVGVQGNPGVPGVVAKGRAAAVFSLQTAATVVAFLACVASLAAGTYNPFIYFRF